MQPSDLEHVRAPEPPAPTGRAAATRPAVVTGLLMALVAAALLTWRVVAGNGDPTVLDDALNTFTRGWADARDWPVDVALVIGRSTSPIPSTIVACVAVIVLALRDARQAAAVIAASAITGALVSQVVKLAVGRQRPPSAEPYASDLLKSFPSGHAMTGIYLYLLLGLVLLHLGAHRGSPWLRRVGVTLVALGPVLGLSRLVLGVHWPLDVLGGWAYGSAVALASALALWWRLDLGWDAGTNGPAPPAAGP
ncbi:MAG TPA: phosphatase PAP2 family protein [Candidatus Nanopelagicales bacterium]